MMSFRLEGTVQLDHRALRLPSWKPTNGIKAPSFCRRGVCGTDREMDLPYITQEEKHKPWLLPPSQSCPSTPDSSQYQTSALMALGLAILRKYAAGHSGAHL